MSNTNGQRLETYGIVGERGARKICLNGGKAHSIKKGEEITVMAFEITDEKIEPTFILVEKNNKSVGYS